MQNRSRRYIEKNVMASKNLLKFDLSSTYTVLHGTCRITERLRGDEML